MAEQQELISQLVETAEIDSERRAYHLRVQEFEMSEQGYEWGGSSEDEDGCTKPRPEVSRCHDVSLSCRELLCLSSNSDLSLSLSLSPSPSFPGHWTQSLSRQHPATWHSRPAYVPYARVLARLLEADD